MTESSLTCLIVGETPATQFLAWRLGLSSCFIILVSKSISSDGLVSWKSSKLGSNFYRPNEFAKEFSELESKLLDSHDKPRYKLDVIVLSCLSFSSLVKYSELLSNFSDKSTVVLINANFGVELEKVVIEKFFDRCSCILSVLCDVEGRQLSSGSYALVDDSCRFFFGVSYVQTKHTLEDTDQMLLTNLRNVQKTFDDKSSTLNSMLTQLQQTKVEEIIRMTPTNDNGMALKVWEHIIPRVSLNILSIVFEQFDYDKLLENTSSSFCFKALVEELMRICWAQCGGVVDKFMAPEFESMEKASAYPDGLAKFIDYGKILEDAKRRKRQMDEFTINEYPEFLTLSFEAYCFYHRLEYPAHILLYQPVLLAGIFDLNYSSLNFLFAFYSRLLSVSGFSIEGGPTKVTVPSLLFGKNSQLTNEEEQNVLSKDESAQTCHTIKSQLKTRKGASGTVKQNHQEEKDDPLSQYRVSTQKETKIAGKSRSWFGALRVAQTHTKCSARPCPIDQCTISEEKDNASVHSIDSNFSQKESFDQEVGSKVEDGGSWRSELSNFLQGGGKRRSNGIDSEDSESLILVDDYVKLPSFRNRQSRLQSVQAGFAQNLILTRRTEQPKATSSATSLEDEIRSEPSGLSRYYCDSYHLKEHQNFMSLRDLEVQKLWKVQRRHMIETGHVVRPSTHPDQQFRDQIKLLKRMNMGGILSLTTSRYGHVDSSQKIFDEWRKGATHVGLPTTITDNCQKD